MRGGRGGMGMTPRFRGGGRGFMGQGPDHRPNRGGGHPRPSAPDPRGRGPPMRYRHWTEELGINEPETFAETRMDDGRCYYYNIRTRETMWERPTGPGVRIIRHEDVAAKDRVLGGQDSAGGHFHDRGNYDGHMGPNGQSFQSLPPIAPNFQQTQIQGQIKGVPNSAGADFSPFVTDDSAPGTSPTVFHGPPPGAHGPRPHSMLIPPPGAHGAQQRFPGSNQGQMLARGPGPRMDAYNSGFPPPGFLQSQPQHGTPFGMPPPGQFPGTNFGMVPPWGFPAGMVPPTGVPPPVAEPLLTQVDPQMAALAAEWTEHVTPEGKTYYYSVKTQASTWDKPKALIDLEAAKLQSQIVGAQPPPSVNPGVGVTKTESDIQNKTIVKRPEKKVEKCRPISSTPVTGTPWCVVWTGDRRVFFYNPATKTSVWERPQDLLGRLDVDEMVRACPEKDKDKLAAKIKLAEATSTTSPLSDGGDKKGKVEVAASVTTTPQTDDTHPPGEGDSVITSDSSEPPHKKVRISSESEEVTIIEDGEATAGSTDDVKELIETKDAMKELTAIEAEAKGSKDRATIPQETRLKQFREMLFEKNVSAFSTWEKELHKIVFDERYLLLASVDRKKAFDRYVEEIMVTEKQDKQNRYKNMKENFFQFLSDVRVSSRMNYSDFSLRYGKDERFRSVEKSRDREAFFVEYIKLVQKKEKEERALRKEKEREDFLNLLTEKVKDYRPSLSDLRKKLESDSRYQVVEPEERDELYRSFQRRLRHEQRALEKGKRRERAAAAAAAKEDSGNDADAKTEKREHNDGPEDISEEEEGCITDDSDEDERFDREKQVRAEQSIREREKEVQRSLATHLRDRDKEREIHRHEEAVQEFLAMLAGTVRNVETTWKETKKVLKKDRRWEFVSVLPREELEDIFASHVDQITRKKKLRFKELLDEHRVTPKTRWRDLYEKIKGDPRCSKFNSSERKCQREFEEYIRDINAQMKVEFRELLKETKMLNYKTNETLRRHSSFMKEIESHLENDRRFLQLEDIPSERERLIREYVEDLEARGPPPPPTASEPIRRK